MTTKERLLLKVMEECDEVSQRVAKALAFGLDEIQEGQSLNNAQRIQDELIDLFAVLYLLEQKGIFVMEKTTTNDVLDQRVKRIEKYLEYSRKLGTVTD